MKTIQIGIKGSLLRYIHRIDELKNTGVFEYGTLDMFKSSVIIEVIIYLNDMLDFCNEHNSRISFTDDINITKAVVDVTSLVRVIRNALCHIDSDNRYVGNPGENYDHLIFWAKPQTAVGLIENDVYVKVNENKYDDDLCFFVGKLQIYINRNLFRAFDEAKTFILHYFNIQ